MVAETVEGSRVCVVGPALVTRYVTLAGHVFPRRDCRSPGRGYSPQRRRTTWSSQSGVWVVGSTWMSDSDVVDQHGGRCREPGLLPRWGIRPRSSPVVLRQLHGVWPEYQSTDRRHGVGNFGVSN